MLIQEAQSDQNRQDVDTVKVLASGEKIYDLNHLFTKKEFEEALAYYWQNGGTYNQKPNQLDVNDPLYYCKYPHTMPPLEAYKIVPPRKDEFCTPAAVQGRQVFYCWDNLNDFEKNHLAELKKALDEAKVVLNEEFDPLFNDRQLLKIYQGYKFVLKDAVKGLAQHANVLQTQFPLAKTLTPKVLRLVQSGAMYIFGKDRFYRPIVILNAHIVNQLFKEDPDIVSKANFISCFIFIYQYIRKVMFLPGHVERWVTITDLGNLGVFQLPKEQIMAFGSFCQDNVAFIIHKSYYLQTSWTMNALYKACYNLIDAEIHRKLMVTNQLAIPELREIIHPNQLEKKFGGNMDSPAPGFYWPPYVGKDFIPEGQTNESMGKQIMDDEEYRQVLEQNPEMLPHPDFLSAEGRTTSRDFKYDAEIIGEFAASFPQMEQVEDQRPEEIKIEKLQIDVKEDAASPTQIVLEEQSPEPKLSVGQSLMMKAVTNEIENRMSKPLENVLWAQIQPKSPTSSDLDILDEEFLSDEKSISPGQRCDIESDIGGTSPKKQMDVKAESKNQQKPQPSDENGKPIKPVSNFNENDQSDKTKNKAQDPKVSKALKPIKQQNLGDKAKKQNACCTIF